MSYAVYVYADANSIQKKIGSQEVNWTGTWTGSGSYAAATYDSIQYNDDRWIATVDNHGVIPTQVFPNKRKNPWSQLIIFQPGDQPPFSPPAPTNDQVFNMAVAGTNLALTAYSISCIGTNVGTNAMNIAGTALAEAGTALQLAQQAIAIASEGFDNYIFGLACVGTFLGTQALYAGTNAILLANQALTTAWAGTNAISLANQALTTAFAGTDLATAGSNLAIQAHREAGTKLDLAGGTLTGNLVVPNVQVGVGTVPYASASNGTIFYDFTGPAYQFTTMHEGTLWGSTKNMAPGREIAVVLQQTGVTLGIAFDSFVWFGTIPPTSISNKNVLVALTSMGTNVANVYAAVSVQQ